MTLEKGLDDEADEQYLVQQLVCSKKNSHQFKALLKQSLHH